MSECRTSEQDVSLKYDIQRAEATYYGRFGSICGTEGLHQHISGCVGGQEIPLGIEDREEQRWEWMFSSGKNILGNKKEFERVDYVWIT